jgi:thiaminase/transcriptional activator TenA
MWGFSEIGLALKERGVPGDPLCAQWVEMYASPEFAEMARWCRTLLDSLAQGLDAARQERLRVAFVTSSRYELRFWEAAQRLEGWNG